LGKPRNSICYMDLRGDTKTDRMGRRNNGYL
jgi:hypothetical protein